MKKVFSLLSVLALVSGSFSIQAQDFEVPEPSFTIPLNGEAELLYNMYQVTWGYYEITDNMGDDPMISTLTLPDGTVKTVKGIISDANMEGTIEDKAPATENNALSFRNFMALDDDMVLIQQYGTYKVNIPAGTVLVNGVPNPEANLEFTIKGQNEVKYMSEAQMVYPTSSYVSFAFSMQLNWPDQEIYFVEDVERLTIMADLDGNPVECKASIQQVEGGNEDGTGYFTMDVLYIEFDDFLSYNDGTYLSVVIPEGIVANADNELNPSQTIELTLLPQISATLSPEDNAELESEDAYVTVSWEGVSVQPIKDSLLFVRDITTRTDIPVDVIFGDDASIKLNLTSLPDGSYEIIIPEAYLLIVTENGIVQDSFAINAEIYATYTIVGSESSGIESLKAQDGLYKVYSIDGRPVVNTSDSNALKSLPSGVYIINGSKTLIRKH